MRAAARAVLLLCSLGLASARVLLEVLAPHQPHTSLLQRPVKGVRCSSATFAAQLRPPLRAARGAREVNLVSPYVGRAWPAYGNSIVHSPRGAPSERSGSGGSPLPLWRRASGVRRVGTGYDQCQLLHALAHTLTPTNPT